MLLSAILCVFFFNYAIRSLVELGALLKEDMIAGYFRSTFIWVTSPLQKKKSWKTRKLFFFSQGHSFYIFKRIQRFVSYYRTDCDLTAPSSTAPSFSSSSSFDICLITWSILWVGYDNGNNNTISYSIW